MRKLKTTLITMVAAFVAVSAVAQPGPYTIIRGAGVQTNVPGSDYTVTASSSGFTNNNASPASFNSSVGIGASGSANNGIILTNSAGNLRIRDSADSPLNLQIGSLNAASFLQAPAFLTISGEARVGNVRIGVNSGMQFTWSSDATDANTGIDTGLKRLAVGVIQPTDGASGNGWVTMGSGEGYLTADATVATATLANIAFSKNISVISGRKYAFSCILFCSEATTTDGIKVDFGGGAATSTYFQAHVKCDNTLGTADLTSLTTAATIATLTGSDMLIIDGAFEPSSTGTFIPRFAKNSGSTGNVTVKRGSHILVWDTP